MATSGTVTFAAGEAAKTLAVPILDDARNDGNETFTLVLSNASGASPELAGDDFGGERLAAARRTAEEQAVVRTQAMRSQHLFAIVLAEDLLHGRQVVRGQHDILEPSNRLADRQQGEAPLPVLGDGGGQIPQRRRGWGLRAAVQDGFEVVGEQVVLFLSLVGDDLLRDAAKGVEVPFGAGADELSQQLAVRHGPNSYPPRTRLRSFAMLASFLR